MKVQAIEREVGKYIGTKQEESQKIIQLLDSRLKQTEDEKRQVEGLLEKTKLQNQEIAKELININAEATASQNELNKARKEAKEKANIAKELEIIAGQREQEIKHLRQEQAAALHQSKTDFMQVQEQLKTEILTLRRERDSLEVRLKQQLIENDQNLE